MRITKETQARLNVLADKMLNGDVSSLDRSDLAIAVIHVRWLNGICEQYKATNWHRRYRKAFAAVGLTMPAMGSDGRAATSALNAARGWDRRRATSAREATHSQSKQRNGVGDPMAGRREPDIGIPTRIRADAGRPCQCGVSAAHSNV